LVALSLRNEDAVSTGILAVAISQSMDLAYTIQDVLIWTAACQVEIVAVDRLKQIADFQSEEESSEMEEKLDSKWLSEDISIVFDDVTVRYNDEDSPALCDFNLAIGSGERVAIVGRTGSG
jgi:ABC-type bacteriocin/lantibiotic exporter with double-glycine peptidase domain